ncbi:MAG: Asp-tRNA(Asn)/Glu-tRNA(Gln) amidotransferase subunit GatA [Bacteroidota bacterium]
MKLYESLADIQRDLSTGLLTVSDLVDFYLDRIEAHQHLNLFVEVFEEEAKEKATLIDAKRAEGTAGRLAGLVIGIKDVICYQGHRLQASSRILDGFDSLFTATALERLLAEDAIVIGRQGCDEFAMGSSNETSVYGPARNPIDEDRVPGGSSGASAAAVAANLCHAALGSDTGGSVRQPSAFCGTIGLKPSYGRISRWGLIAYASSFDQIGPITRSVEDAALLLEIMAGPDGKDNTASSQPVLPYSTALSAEKPMTIGYLQEALDSPGLDPQIHARTQTILADLKAAGHQLKPLSFPLLEHVVPCYYILTTAEASSNLSRFDGIRYGHRSEKAHDLESVYRLSRSEAFGSEVQRRIMLGTFVLSAGYFDAYYTKAMKVRRLIKEATEQMFAACDVILTPTAPGPAFRIGEKMDDPIEMFLSDIYTVHANLAGVPAISLPLGKTDEGLPFGIQLMGQAFQEDQMLNLAHRMMIGEKG